MVGLDLDLGDGAGSRRHEIGDVRLETFEPERERSGTVSPYAGTGTGWNLVVRAWLMKAGLPLGRCALGDWVG